MLDFSGTWTLVSAASAETDIELDADEPSAATAISAQLRRSAFELLPAAERTDGLLLEILGSDRFTHTLMGNPKVLWFGADGVLENAVVPFNGTCNATLDRLYLLAADCPIWAQPQADRQASFRYDDGDTLICDFVELIQGQLYRTVNVLTDGLYKSQILMVFERC